MRPLLPLCLALALPAAGAPLAGDAEKPGATGTLRLRPAPPSGATVQRMQSWHRGYRYRISPVLREWERLARLARGRPGDRLTAGCRRLDLALAGLHRDRLPVAPDPSVSLHLEETLRVLAEAARSCTEGAYFLATWRLREAEASWRELRGRLQIYGLAP